MSLPKVLNRWRVNVSGTALGTMVSKITLPSLEREMVEFRGGSMLGPVKLDMGLKACAVEFTIPEDHPEIIALWGLSKVSGVRLRFTGALSNDATGEASAGELTVTGRLSKIDMGEAEPGKLKETKYTIDVATFSYAVDGKVLLAFDYISGAETVNGEDLAAALSKLLTKLV